MKPTYIQMQNQPKWFRPGILVMVRNDETEDWEGPRIGLWYEEVPDDVEHTAPNFFCKVKDPTDGDCDWFKFAKPYESWKPKEGEIVLAFHKPQRFGSIEEYDNDLLGNHGEPFDIFIRMKYEDGRVTDCTKIFDELKEECDYYENN